MQLHYTHSQVRNLPRQATHEVKNSNNGGTAYFICERDAWYKVDEREDWTHATPVLSAPRNCVAIERVEV